MFVVLSSVLVCLALLPEMVKELQEEYAEGEADAIDDDAAEEGSCKYRP